MRGFQVRRGLADHRALLADDLKLPYRCGRHAMHRLISGIVEFHERQLSKYAERFRDLALAQSPDTFMVTCSD